MKTVGYGRVTKSKVKGKKVNITVPAPERSLGTVGYTYTF
jgi:hypothetical protein